MKANINKPKGRKFGYLYIDLQKAKDGRHWKERRNTLMVHKLVLLAFAGPCPEGFIGCHKNDVKTDNNIDNLYYGTYSDNARDSIRLGTFNFPHPGMGEDHHSCKYSDELITKIKSEFTGIRGNQTALAKKYGISQQYISAILLEKVRKAA